MKEPNSYLAKAWGKFSALSEKNYTFLEEMKSEGDLYHWAKGGGEASER